MKKITFVGGGSGGHIIPGIALYTALSRRGECDFFWIGEADSMEEKESEKIGVRFFKITAGKVPRYFSPSIFLAPVKLVRGIFQVYRLLKTERPDGIFSKGSAVSIPVGIAAFLLKIPFVLHESDTVPGISNRITSLFATKIFLGFEHAKRYFSQDKVEIVGQILHPLLLESAEEVIKTKHASNRVLVQCGSLGSATVFRALLQALPLLGDFQFTVVLGTLNTGFRSSFEKFTNVEVIEWADANTMANLYASADFAIARSGATSLAELQLFGIRSILIPYTYSAGNHQYFNAVEWCSIYKENILLSEKNINDLAQTLQLLKEKRDISEENNYLKAPVALNRIVTYLLAGQ